MGRDALHLKIEKQRKQKREDSYSSLYVHIKEKDEKKWLVYMQQSTFYEHVCSYNGTGRRTTSTTNMYTKHVPRPAHPSSPLLVASCQRAGVFPRHRAVRAREGGQVQHVA